MLPSRLSLSLSSSLPLSLSLSLSLLFSVRVLLRVTSANLSIVRVSREKCSESGYKKENSAFVHLSLPAFVDTKKFPTGTLEGRRRIKRKCPLLTLSYVSWGNITNDRRLETLNFAELRLGFQLECPRKSYQERFVSHLLSLCLFQSPRISVMSTISLGIFSPSGLLSNNKKIIQNRSTEFGAETK
jgi:hypothetical protein